jgi:peptidoglycan/LPS O-acetylase OafA/YrhL
MSTKDIPLEALRGLAAIVVLAHHCLAAASPNIAFDDIARPIHGQPWYVFINGSGAVNLFFVLSGYVLTRRCLLTGDTDIILRGAVKRWPRLLGPVLVSCLFSWLLFATGAYHFMEAGETIHSTWVPNLTITQLYSHGTISDALSQGVFTFFWGTTSFNPVLWTMQPEFLGSMIAFSLALFLCKLPRSNPIPAMILLAIVALTCHIHYARLMAFPLGVALAYFLPRRQQLPLFVSLPALGIGLYLLGYLRFNIGIYYPLSASQIFETHPIYVNTIGAVLLLIAVETSQPIRRALSIRGMPFVGELSFPLYLIHLPVICSLGATIMIAMAGSSLMPPATIIASAAASVALAIPLLLFNRWWLALVNRTTSVVLLPNNALKEVEIETVLRESSGTL